MKPKNALRIVLCLLMIAGLLFLGSCDDRKPPETEPTVHVDCVNGSDTNDGSSWDDAVATIQQGIDLADNGFIVLVADGTYTGDGNKNLDFNDKPTIVKSVNGPETCVINCENAGSGFCLYSNGFMTDCTIEGFTIRNGNAEYGDGGGICCGCYTLAVINCRILNSIADCRGGGIFAGESNLIVRNCVIKNNTAESGSGIFYSVSYDTNLRYFELKDCVIDNNTAGYNGYYDGHCVCCRNGYGLDWSNCRITNNTGSGIQFSDFDVTASNFTIANNTNIGFDAGGIDSEGSEIVFKNSIIWGNRSGFDEGHQFSIIAESLTLINCNYADNTLDSENVGLHGAELTATDCIVSDPLFTSGPKGGFYLSQLASGQVADSPSIDSGSEDASAQSLDVKTTRTDSIGDTGIVDQGYHNEP